MPDQIRRVQTALLSVSDKSGLQGFARSLVAAGVQLISTGGTFAALSAAGIPVREVSDVTGFPEMMDGRIKTLHPKVHGGLLARRADPQHQASAISHGIGLIDLLVVNLYPFEATVAAGRSYSECVENIDIGGPAMIRAAAKNHEDVAVVVDPADYGAVLDELAAYKGSVTSVLRKRLAQKAFARTAAYDAAISNWMAGAVGVEQPDWRAFGGELAIPLRYGENPHQRAALYRGPVARAGVVGALLVQGKQLSYNNINDTNAAYECVAEFDPQQTAACVVVKHANPCGVAEASDLTQAYRLALRCDPVSAFGGIVAFNRPLDAQTAQEVIEVFTEVIIAPDASPEAVAIIASRKNLRLLLAGGLPDPAAPGLSISTVAGGFLVQQRDHAVVDAMALKVVTKRAPDARELRDMAFAFRVAKHVKSNAIVYAKDGATVGIGAGQMSRVDSSRIAAWKAAEASKAAGLPQTLASGCVVASDAFFPFPDGLIAAAEAGAIGVIQPGGSVRDAEVIAAADAAGLAMVFTGHRHFRH